MQASSSAQRRRDCRLRWSIGSLFPTPPSLSHRNLFHDHVPAGAKSHERRGVGNDRATICFALLASRATVSKARTTSPSNSGMPGISVSPAGKDRTLVDRFLFRNRPFSACTSTSSPNTMLSSASPLPQFSRRQLASAACRDKLSAAGNWSVHFGDSIVISMFK